MVVLCSKVGGIWEGGVGVSYPSPKKIKVWGVVSENSCLCALAFILELLTGVGCTAFFCREKFRSVNNGLC